MWRLAISGRWLMEVSNEGREQHFPSDPLNQQGRFDEKEDGWNTLGETSPDGIQQFCSHTGPACHQLFMIHNKEH